MATPGRAQGGALLDRRAEALAIRQFAETTHPRGREAAAHADWQGRWARVAEAAQGPDGVYVVAIRRALAWFNDGHSSVAVHANGGVPGPLQGGEWGMTMPLSLAAFDDGLWVTGAGGPAADLLGLRLASINGVSAADLMRRHADAWTGSDAWAHAWGGVVLASPGDLIGLGIMTRASEPPRFAVEGSTGSLLVRDIQPVASGLALQEAPRATSDVERWTTEAGGRNFMRILDGGGTIYLSLDHMGDVDGHGFLDLTRAALGAMAEPKAGRVVVDLRRNRGGSNDLGEPLRKALTRSRFNRPGGLYVLIGPSTFSAAQNLATRLERETYAVFAGGPSGAAPNHYGDARAFVGRATGLPVFVSTLPWFDSAPQDPRAWISPDLATGWTFADWQAGRDPAMAAVLADSRSGEGNDLGLLRTYPYRRRSQSQPWTTFWRQ